MQQGKQEGSRTGHANLSSEDAALCECSTNSKSMLERASKGRKTVTDYYDAACNALSREDLPR